MIIAVKTEPHTEYLRMNLLVAEMSTIQLNSMLDFFEQSLHLNMLNPSSYVQRNINLIEMLSQ